MCVAQRGLQALVRGRDAPAGAQVSREHKPIEVRALAVEAVQGVGAGGATTSLCAVYIINSMVYAIGIRRHLAEQAQSFGVVPADVLQRAYRREEFRTLTLELLGIRDVPSTYIKCISCLIA